MNTPSLQLSFSKHASRRKAQRAISDGAVDAALRWGRFERQGKGRRVFHLGRRSVAAAKAVGVDVSSHRHVGVVLGRDGGVITVFRSPNTRRLRRRRR